MTNLAPSIRFPEFDKDWKQTNFKELFDFQNGMNAGPERYGHGIKYISVGDILNTPFLMYDNIKGLVDANEKEKNNFRVSFGDVLFQRSSENFNDAGRANVYLDKNKDCVFGGFVIRGKKIGEYNPSFIKYALEAEVNRQKIIRLAAGAQHINIGQKELNSVSIFMPTLEEQDKIASLFDSIEKEILSKENLIRHLKRYKKEIVNKVFFEIGEKHNWSKISLFKVLHERKEFSVKDSSYVHATLSKEGIFPKTDRYDRDFLVKDESKEYKITKMDDICYNPANLKFGVICRNNYGDAIFSPIYVTFEVNKGYNPAFVEAFLCSNNFIQDIRRFEEGTVYERMAVKPEDFLNGEIPSPCREEQDKYANLFVSIDELISSQSRMIELLKTRKSYLLGNMFI